MAGAGKIHPGRLLLTLKVLLAPSGGIKSSAEVDRLVPLMEKFSRKLVSRIIYLNVLLSSSNDLLELFLSRKGWSLLSLWFVGATNSNNVPLRIKLLQVCLRCSPPPPHEEFDEMLSYIKALTKRIKQIEMSVLALQVLNKWNIPTSLGTSSDTDLSLGASTKPTETTKQETTKKTESFSSFSFTIPKRIKKPRLGSLRVTYQEGDCIKDHAKSKKTAQSSDGPLANVIEQTWSRINGLKRKEVYSSLSSYAAADKTQSRLSAFPSRSQGSKPDLPVKSQDNEGVNEIESNKKESIKDVNENFTRSIKLQATSNTFFCEDKFYDEDLRKEKESRTEDNSLSLKKPGQLTVREDSEKRRKEVDDFKRKRREERDQKLRRQEEQQKAKISFNKTEYKRDLDNDSKKKIKELAESLKQQDEKEDRSSMKKEVTTTKKNPSSQKSERNPSKKDDGSSSSSSPKTSARKPSKKEDRSSSSPSPKRRKVLSRNRISSGDRHRSNSRRRSRSRDRTNRGGRETISGIRRLRRSKSRSRSRSRSPRKRRREEKEPRNSSTPSKSKLESKSSSRVFAPKEAWKEVNLFNDELLKSCRETKSKRKRVSRVKSKSSRSSSNSKSSGSDSKPPVPEKSNENKENTMHRKRVTWAKDENLVKVKFFEVVDEERGNVFRQKFAEKRKLEAKNEKLKLTAASKANSFECESSCSKSESFKINFKSSVPGSSWPSLIPLAGLRTDIQTGSQSEERLIQRAREAQVQPLPILPGAEPTEAETIHQRRSMVVSVKSILPVDISGEGTITDFSAGGWTSTSQFTRGVKYQTSNVPGYLQSNGAVKGGKVPVPCIYWGRGYCRNGDACRFLHEPKAAT